MVTVVREGNKVVGETLIAPHSGPRQPLGAEALPSLYDDSYPRLGSLVVAAAIASATAIWMPAYRWFLLISIGIGAAVAAGLYLWHKLRPVRDDDVENKSPLGLS